jgi:hypothetical protein
MDGPTVLTDKWFTTLVIIFWSNEDLGREDPQILWGALASPQVTQGFQLPVVQFGARQKEAGEMRGGGETKKERSSCLDFSLLNVSFSD